MELSGIVGYRELPVVQKTVNKCREFKIQTGSGQASLEVVSVPEKAGGLVFQEPFSSRFLYWRTQQGGIELTEENLDAKLQGNRIRIRLLSTPILGDSVSLYESGQCVILLLCSVGSIHRIAFPHPSLLDKNRSILSDFTVSMLQDFHRPSLSGQITMCSNYLTATNDAMFVLGTTTSVHLIIFYASGEVQTKELQRTRTIKKRLTGMLPTVMRPREGFDETPAAVACLEHDRDFFVVAISNDQRLCVWSVNRDELVANENLADLMGPEAGFIDGGGAPQMKRVLNMNLLLVHAHGCFAVLKPQIGATITFTSLVTVPFPEVNVIDFAANPSHLWALYLNAQGEPVMASTDFTEPDSLMWNAVHWADPINSERKTHLMDGTLSETYLDRIFRSDCFAPTTLAKTVAIFRRTEFADKLPPHSGSLRDEILELIRVAIEKRLDLGMDEEEAQMDAYEKFISYCIQYHTDGIKPLGFVLSNYVVAVVKTEQIGVIQECDEAERVLLSHSLEPFQSGGIAQFVDCLRLVNNHLDDDALDSLSLDVFNNNPLDSTVWQLAAVINAKPDFSAPFIKIAKTIGKVWAESLSRLIVLIDSEVSYPQDNPHEPQPDHFSGPLGITLLAQNVYQRASLMYDLCRRLIVFEALLVLNHDKIGIAPSSAHSIKTELLNSTIYTLRCYFLVLWACEMETDQPESFTGRLNTLSIAGSPGPSFQTVMELFLANDNTATMLAQKKVGLDRDFFSLLFEISRYNCCLLSPSPESSYQLLQVLMQKQQYGHLQEFLRLLDWDSARKGLKNFILAHALLKCGDIDRACDVFVEFHDEAVQDPFVIEEIGQKNSELISITYYQKIINVLESMGCTDQIIRVAEAALATNPPCPYTIELHCLIFRHELQNGRIVRACEALARVPDQEMQRGCLRELVSSSLERKTHYVLVEFAEKNLRHELLHIMTHRARSSDLDAETSLYDLLYCCHIRDRDFREAASIMFEQGLRLSRELQGLGSLAKQELCFLSAISCLQLLNDRGIVRPKTRRDVSMGEDDSEDIEGTMEVLELPAFEKELALVQSWMKLMEVDKTLVTPISPEETVALLIRHSMYDTAVQLCELFDIDRATLFEHVALACCRAPMEHENVNEIGPRNPEWILENTEFVNSIPKAAWFYLRHLLLRSEGTKYFRVCARVFLLSACSLPAWFVVEYQRRNVTELLKVYITFERLIEATELACQVIDAHLGRNPELFNVSDTVASGKPVWIPLHIIDGLQFKLFQAEGKRAVLLRDTLLSKLDEMFTKVENVSKIR